MTSYLNTINSENTDLNINNTAGYPVVIGNSLTSILGTRTFGASIIGAITGSSATFSTTLGVTGLATFGLGGLTSTSGTTTLGPTTVGAITGTSASFSTTLGVTGLSTFGAGGLTSTAGTTTLGTSTIGAITGTSATFSSTLGVTGLSTFGAGGLTSTAGTTTLGTTGITTLTSTTGTITNLTATTSFTSTAGTTILGASTIGAITGTSASFSSILGVTGLATFGIGGLTSIAGTTILGASTIGAITGTSASFSSTLGVTGLATFGIGGLTSTAGTTILGASTIGAITGTSAYFSSTLGVTGLATFGIGGLTSTSGTTTLGATTIGAITGTSASFSSQITSTVTNGTAPLIIASTTNVANLNASLLNGATFSSPGPIGSVTTSTGDFTTIVTSGITSSSGTNSFGAMSLTGAIAMGNNKITGLGTPSSGTDAATKSYVDSVSSGTSAKTSVKVATITTGTLSNSFANGQTVDGITLVTGYRILIKDQSSQIENGIYTVNAIGSPSRATDFLTGSTQAGTYVFVEEGTVNDNAGFICNSSAGSDLVGTDNITFSQFTGAAQINAGTGLSKSGNTLNVNVSQTQITSVGTLTSLTVTGTSSFAVTTVSSTLGVTGVSSLRDIEIIGSSSGIVTVKAQSNAGTFNFNLPTGSGNSTDLLTSGGGASNPMTWTSVSGTGSVIRSSGATSSDMTITTLTSTSGTFTGNLSGGNLLTSGELRMSGSSSGTITIRTQANSGTYNFQLPNTLGTSGQVLTSGTPLTWTTPTVGTVTSVDLSVPSFLSISGNPITTSGTLAIGLSGTALNVANGGTGATTLNANSVLLGNGTSAISSPSNLTFATSVLTTPRLTSNDTTSSTSSVLGAVLISGGISISNTTDATSSTNGGTFTTAGGLAISKKLFVGDSISTLSNVSSISFKLNGSTSGTISINGQPNAGTYNFNLPTTSGNIGQMLISGGGSGTAMTWTNAPTQAAPQTFTATGLQTQVTPVNVTGLLYTSGRFDIRMVVEIIATTNLTQIFDLSGVLSPSSGWSLTAISVSGDSTGVDFTISAGGNIQYTSGTYTGFTVLNFSWSEFSSTQGLNYVALGGSISGVVTIAPQSSAGTYNFNLPTTSGSSGQILTSGGGSGNPMTWSPVTGTGNVVFSASPTLTGTVTADSANFSGALSKGSGSFDIEHPLYPTKRLVHSFIEGPRCDNIYRNRKQLTNGKAVVNLDKECTNNRDNSMTEGTFVALNTNPTCYLQNNETFDHVKCTISGNKLIIISQNPDSNATIDWMVVGERKDTFIKNWERTDSNGYLKTEYF